jgi:hypothetical protein
LGATPRRARNTAGGYGIPPQGPALMPSNFAIDFIHYLPNTEYGVPGCTYQISSECGTVIKGFLANLSLKAGKMELEFQLKEFHERLNAPSFQWTTKSHSHNAPINHRLNQVQKRRKEHARISRMQPHLQCL